MPRPKNTQQRRAQIVEGLIQAMAVHGYGGASVPTIAKAAGLTPGLLHYHFSSKGEVLLAALEHLADSHQKRLGSALEHAGQTPHAQLHAFIDVHLALDRSADPAALACWILLSGEALRDREVQSAYEQALATSRQRLIEIIEDGVKQRAFECDNVDAAAAGLLAAIQGYFALNATAGRLIPKGTAAENVKRMAAGLLSPQSRASVEGS